MKNQNGNTKYLAFILKISCWGYIIWLWSWLFLKITFQDHWWWLGFLNNFSVYWFSPLLIIGPIAFLPRKQLFLKTASLVSIGIFLLMFGPLLIPKMQQNNPVDLTISIMTYNLYGGNHDWEAIQHTILESNADVVAVQELNQEMAAKMQTELAESYPHQILDSQDSILSRYPITVTDHTLRDSWGSPPKIYLIEVNGQTITLLNAHFYASLPTSDIQFMQWVFREREHQAQVVSEFAAQIETPLIVTADLNATDQNQAYQIVTQKLNDAWREAGWGLGHTFPGGPIPSMPRLAIAGKSWPQWMARIDYIFYSNEWQAVAARVGTWDGVSDHRPVIAVLALEEPSTKTP